jgi:uncharacterized membrane protein YfcA
LALDISIPLLIVLMFVLFIIAMLSSNLGIGGGILFVPILSIFFPDYAPLMIVPLSLIFAFCTNVPAAYNHWQEQLVDIKTGGLMLITALVGAILGALFTVGIPEVVFLGMFTTLLTVVGGRMGFKFYRKHSSPVKERKDDPSKRNLQRTIIVVIISLFTGFLAGSMGIGGGVITVSILIVILGFRTRRAIGTSAFIIPAITIFSFCTYLVVDVTGPEPEINYLLIPLLAPMVIIGAFTGSRLGLKFIPPKAIEVLFLIVVVAAWGKMTFSFIAEIIAYF